MGKFDDYINSLEGKENIDPLVVASTLHELHNEEIGIHVAKIETLDSTIAEKDSAFTEITNELTLQKAKNLDLVMQIPTPGVQQEKDAENENSEITIDDLFKKKGS